jgi:hypothetical protein
MKYTMTYSSSHQFQDLLGGLSHNSYTYSFQTSSFIDINSIVEKTLNKEKSFFW